MKYVIRQMGQLDRVKMIVPYQAEVGGVILRKNVRYIDALEAVFNQIRPGDKYQLIPLVRHPERERDYKGFMELYWR